MSSLTTLRWGIIGTGQVSSWFVRDLTRPRPDANAHHIIQAIGCSHRDKGQRFVQEFLSGVGAASSSPPIVYGSYQEVYADPLVNIVYIGIPHGLHKQACLDAIAAGKHVLCEKAFGLHAGEAKEVFAAAEQKGGIFVMEALRMRFFPLVRQLLSLVHEDKMIGAVMRVFCDLGLELDIASLGPDSRLRNPALGAGTLLDICIYSLTWGVLLMDDKSQGQGQGDLSIQSFQTLSDGIDTATSVLLFRPATGAHGILTSTAKAKTPHMFCRIEGTEGHITVEGESASIPSAFTVHRKAGHTSYAGNEYDVVVASAPQTFKLEPPGWGLYWEADAVAEDIAAGRVQNDMMPWAETVRILEMMDEVRRQGGARFPQDD